LNTKSHVNRSPIKVPRSTKVSADVDSIPTVETVEYDFFLLIYRKMNILLYNRTTNVTSITKRTKIIVGVVSCLIVLGAGLGIGLYFGIGSKNCVI
jgi:hypothetical protein